MPDIAFRPASELTEALRNKEISSRELLEEYLRRVARFGPGLNAVVTLAEEKARRRALAADEALARGELWGPLHGLPMTVKDAIETAGIRTTGGVPELADHVPDTDADTVARLRAAGAVIFGKTNVPVGSADWQSFNPIFGCTNNPWNVDRTPGGSSGGSAAALAAGLTGFEVGSDIAGSIRTPAHYCGVYGLKTSHGLVPAHGHIPPSPGGLGEMDLAVLGPMGRAPEDLDLGLDILSGAAPERAVAWRLELPPPRATALNGFRVAVWLDDAYCTVDREVLAVMQDAVEAIRKAGAEVDDTARPVGLEESHRVYLGLLMGVGAGVLSDEDFEAALALGAGDTGAVFAPRLVTQRARDWHRLDEERHRMRARWAAFFKDHDVLLCPVVPTAAIPHDHAPDQEGRRTIVNGETRSYLSDMTTWSGMINMPLLPSAMAPIGLTREGLPVGIQIVAPYLEDRTATRFAGLLRDLVGGFRPPAGYASHEAR
ncbi:amidase [Actinomadura chokoriensis]|uniref:Amidase n=1 Tax=Actinomadura chokoriensis TaxID=454156 RepID=A0ABV4QVF3_9ACTN